MEGLGLTWQSASWWSQLASKDSDFVLWAEFRDGVIVPGKISKELVSSMICCK